MRRTTRALLSTLLLLHPSLPSLFLASASATCYRPGGVAADPRYQPCASGSAASMCCRTNDADRPDICRGDGLCQSNYQLDYIWRESCTDGTWTSPECLPLCTDGLGFGNDTLLTFCQDGSLCCGYDNATCCATGQGVFLFHGRVTTSKPSGFVSLEPPGVTTSVQSTAAPASSSPSTTGASSSTGSSTTEAAPADAASTTTSLSPPPPTSSTGGSGGSSSLSTGAAAGIGVGVGVVAIAAIVAVVVFYLTRRRQRSDAMAAIAPAAEMEQPAAKFAYAPGPATYELGTNVVSPIPVELPAGRGASVESAKAGREVAVSNARGYYE